MNRFSWKRLAAWCAVALVLALTTPLVWALDRPPWDKLTTKVGPDAEVPGWYINLGITGARAMIAEAEPKVLLVTFVFKDTPASGKLQKGDKIIGVNGRPFVTAHKFGYGMDKFGYEGPMMDFGNALEESQGQRGGKLVLDVLRGDQKLQVELQLTTKYGSFSATYPFDCQKTDVILQETYAYLIKEQKADGTWSDRPHINAFAALALLGSGDPAYLPAVKKCRPSDGPIHDRRGSSRRPARLEVLAVWHRSGRVLSGHPRALGAARVGRDQSVADQGSASGNQPAGTKAHCRRIWPCSALCRRAATGMVRSTSSRRKP